MADPAIIESFFRFMKSNYIEVAGTAVLYYDYLLTFDSEVALIWKSPWSLVKVLFLIMRYAPFVDVTSKVYYDITPGTTPEGCVAATRISPVCISIGVIVAEILLAIRTWSLWRRNNYVALIFFATGVGCTVPSMFVIRDYFHSIFYIPSPFPSLFPCVTTKRDNLYISYALLIGFEAVILAFTVVPGVKAFKQGKSHFVRMVYRDGILYYVYLGALSVVNIIMILTLPSGYDYALVVVHRVFHAILTARIIFRLREESSRAPSLPSPISPRKKKFSFIRPVAPLVGVGVS